MRLRQPNSAKGNTGGTPELRLNDEWVQEAAQNAAQEWDALFMMHWCWCCAFFLCCCCFFCCFFDAVVFFCCFGAVFFAAFAYSVFCFCCCCFVRGLVSALYVGWCAGCEWVVRGGFAREFVCVVRGFVCEVVRECDVVCEFVSGFVYELCVSLCAFNNEFVRVFVSELCVCCTRVYVWVVSACVVWVCLLYVWVNRICARVCDCVVRGEFVRGLCVSCVCVCACVCVWVVCGLWVSCN